MNPVRSLWCRAYQTCFRAAIPLLPYREPTPLATFSDCAEVLREHGATKVLVVTDKTISGLGLLDPMLAELAKAGIEVAIFDRVVPNPTISNVEAARELYLAEGCKAIIAFGGGSAMDCAKAAGARIARPRKPVAKMRGVLKVLAKLPLLIAVPTTAGTGSETTLAAVITDDETHYKYPINDFALIPRYAVLDYRTTLDLPASVTATTGMDALVHAVEAYIGRSTTRDTRANAIQAVHEIHEYLLRAYRDGHDAVAREHMLRAAYQAGLAFTKSYVGYVHAVAHSLGGQYGIAHGLANAVLLPLVLESYGPSCERRLADLARKAGVCDHDDDHDASRAFIAWVREMNAAMQIPATLDGIRDEDIPLMARHADAEGNPLYPVPRLMDARELEELYHLVKTPADLDTATSKPASASEENASSVSGEHATARAQAASAAPVVGRHPEKLAARAEAAEGSRKSDEARKAAGPSGATPDKVGHHPEKRAGNAALEKNRNRTHVHR